MASADAQIAPKLPATAVALADEPDLWFELPPGFMEFDLAEDAEARMLRMADATDALFVAATPEQKFSLVVSGEYVLQTMIAAGAEHVSSCFLRMSDGELSQGTLCVLVERPDTGLQSQDRQGSARRTAVQWRELYPDAEIGLVMLPYGIAALCIHDQDLQIPGVLFGLDDPIPATVRQLQLCLPLQTGPGSALFVFTTQDIAHWSEYLEVLSAIMKSVSTYEPQGDDRPGPDGPAAGGTET
ncbi:hypothetical protein EDD90_1584 [Streptomyces sp. Ag109_O5-1]|uniref:hypothetical protein n=1 Tax=Streptomyces sp. Ag109_O5-1 TaxID=1938851 RepID=UPI000F503F70|nr:hypothetical protein [Streptomyces sp. Ag109_O5-1]RPE38664.1 hypothetical protein EDD90_1584 [Streptomyces sp. Ag109_O5-1]